MNKRSILFLLLNLLVVSVLVVLVSNGNFGRNPQVFTNSVDDNVLSVEDSLLKANSYQITKDGENFNTLVIQISGFGDVELVPNFNTKMTSSEAFDRYGCKIISSGGFYDTNSNPIGFFKANQKEIGKYSDNYLFNAVLTKNDLDTFRITREVPDDQIIWGFQAGPLLKENGSYVFGDTLYSEGSARRMLTAIDGENKLYILLVNKVNQSYNGPTYIQLLEVLKSLEEVSGIVFADILNIDGGTASALIAPNMQYLELNNVGSFLCVK